MIYNVTLSFSVDSSQYVGIDSEDEVKRLVNTMMECGTDLPDTFDVKVEENQ